MKSKKREITIIKARDIGIYPTYINTAQRHLEKEMPLGEVSGVVTHFTVPVDLLSVGGLVPPEMLEQIETVELAYDRKGSKL